MKRILKSAFFWTSTAMSFPKENGRCWIFIRYEGYLPTKTAFEEGGYEANSSPFTPNLEEACVAAAVKLIRELNI